MNRLPTAALLLMLLILSSCQTDVDTRDLEPEARLTLNSLFSPDSTWLIHLGSSSSVWGNPSPPPPNRPQVRLRTLDGRGIPCTDLGGGYFEAAEPALAGTHYQVEVEATGWDPISADCQVPVPVPIRSAVATDSLNAAGQPFRSRTRLEFDDPPGINWYFVALLNDSPQEANLPVPLQWTNPDLDAFHFFQEREYQCTVFSDRGFDGQSVSLDWYSDYLYAIPNLVSYRLVLGSLSESWYRYLKTYVRLNENPPGPGSESVVLHSNVVGGYGIFAASSVSEVSLR